MSYTVRQGIPSSGHRASHEGSHVEALVDEVVDNAFAAIQIERGFSCVWVASGGTQLDYLEQVHDAREQVDSTHRDLPEENLSSHLNELAILRQGVDAFCASDSATTPEAQAQHFYATFANYGRVLDGLLAAETPPASSSPCASPAQDLSVLCQASFAKLREAWGEIRGFVCGALALPDAAVKHLPARAFADLVTSIHRQRAEEAAILSATPPMLRPLLTAGFASIPELQCLQETLLGDFDVLALRRMQPSPTQWWNALTTQLHKVHELQRLVSREMRKLASNGQLLGGPGGFCLSPAAGSPLGSTRASVAPSASASLAVSVHGSPRGASPQAPRRAAVVTPGASPAPPSSAGARCTHEQQQPSTAAAAAGGGGLLGDGVASRSKAALAQAEAAHTALALALSLLTRGASPRGASPRGASPRGASPRGEEEAAATPDSHEGAPKEGLPTEAALRGAEAALRGAEAAVAAASPAALQAALLALLTSRRGALPTGAPTGTPTGVLTGVLTGTPTGTPAPATEALRRQGLDSWSRRASREGVGSRAGVKAGVRDNAAGGAHGMAPKLNLAVPLAPLELTPTPHPKLTPTPTPTADPTDVSLGDDGSDRSRSGAQGGEEEKEVGGSEVMAEKEKEAEKKEEKKEKEGGSSLVLTPLGRRRGRLSKEGTHPNPPRNPMIRLEELHLERRIGDGGFSTTYRAAWNKGGGEAPSVVAVKVAASVGDSLEQWRQEVRALTTLDHPNIVRFLGCVSSGKVQRTIPTRARTRRTRCCCLPATGPLLPSCPSYLLDTYVHNDTQRETERHTHTHTHAQTRTHARTRAHTHTHAHTHAHTHRSHRLPCPLSCLTPSLPLPLLPRHRRTPSSSSSARRVTSTQPSRGPPPRGLCCTSPEVWPRPWRTCTASASYTVTSSRPTF